MAYTPPNVFANGTSLDADLVQQNNDAMKTYVDGGAIIADVSSASWVRAPHIMRGTYIPLQNLHEFATGVVRGATYEQNDVTVSADRYRTPYPAFLGSNRNTSVEFTNESSNYTVRIGWQVFPKHPPLDGGTSTTVQNLAQTTVEALYPTYTCQESDAGNYRNTGTTFEQAIPGFYRRRVIQNWEYEDTSGAALGNLNTITWYVGTNNIVNDFADFGYQLEVYYT